MKRYKDFINEDITKFMTPKSGDDIEEKLSKLGICDKLDIIHKYNLDRDRYYPSDDEIIIEIEKLNDDEKKIKTIIKHQLDYNLLPRDENGVCTCNGNVICYSHNLTKLPDKLVVRGYLDCSDNNLTELPNNLTVIGVLYCCENQLTELPNDLIIHNKLICSYNNLAKLPDKLVVNGNLDCCDNNLTELPDDLIVNGNIYCIGNKNTLKIPPSAKITGYSYK